MNARIFTMVGALALLVSCNKDKEKSATGFVEVVLSNGSLSLLAESVELTEFDLKITEVYLTEDIDPDTGENKGTTSFIYVNPSCPGETDCDVTRAEYVDMIDPESANAELNSQKRPVTVWVGEGDPPSDASRSFRYLRIGVCANQDDPKPTMRWATDLVSRQELVAPLCEIQSSRMDPPLIVKEGQTVKVVLNYTLEDSVAAEDGLNRHPSGRDGHCAEDANGLATCMAIPEFEATAQVSE